MEALPRILDLQVNAWSIKVLLRGAEHREQCVTSRSQVTSWLCFTYSKTLTVRIV